MLIIIKTISLFVILIVRNYLVCSPINYYDLQFKTKKDPIIINLIWKCFVFYKTEIQSIIVSETRRQKLNDLCLVPCQ